VKKTAIIGIGIAIIVAGIIGIYAVSTTQEGESATESGVGIGDEADVTIKEGIEEAQPSFEEPIGLEDKAVATEELEDADEVPAKDPIGIQDKAVATAENP